MKVTEESEVNSKRQEKPLKKQDVVLSDAHESCRIVLWKVVQEYGGVKYLSFSESGRANKVADKGQVISEGEDFKQELQRRNKVE